MIKIANAFGTPLGFLKDTRAFFISCRDNVSEEVRVGLNYNIIVDTAFILEAESEALIHSIVDQYEQIYIKFYQPDLTDCDAKLAANAKTLLRSSFSMIKNYSSKKTGMEHYKTIFNILIPESDLTTIKPFEEGIQVLYQFRNVIAHGRAIRFEERTYYAYPDYDNEVKKEIDFMGGYKKVQDYLIKKGLLEQPITESLDYKSLFSDAICDHMIKVESDYYEALKKCVPFTLIDYRDDCEIL